MQRAQKYRQWNKDSSYSASARAPPEGGERPAAPTRSNGSCRWGGAARNCTALPVHGLVALPATPGLLLRAKPLSGAAKRAGSIEQTFGRVEQLRRGSSGDKRQTGGSAMT